MSKLTQTIVKIPKLDKIVQDAKKAFEALKEAKNVAKIIEANYLYCDYPGAPYYQV